jgi:hypothetical protein
VPRHLRRYSPDDENETVDDARAVAAAMEKEMMRYHPPRTLNPKP